MKKLVEKLNKDREEEKEREVLAVLEEKAYKDALKDYKKQEDLDKLTEFHKKQYDFYTIIIITQSIDCFTKVRDSHGRTILNSLFSFKTDYKFRFLVKN